MGKTRALGALLSIACIAVMVLHLYFGYVNNPAAWAIGLSFALPVTVGVLAACGLGLWLGWIMATTKEVAPPKVEPAKESTEEKKK